MKTKRQLLGQHFLRSAEVVEQLVAAAEPRATDVALEIGTGTGIVTRSIAALVKNVLTYEVDEELFQHRDLAGVSKLENVEIKRLDLLTSQETIPRFDICIASLPYSRSRDFVHWLATVPFRFRVAAVVVQEEFARKLVAKPSSENYRAISVIAQLSFQISLESRVSREAFNPEPKVSSRIVTLCPTVGRFPVLDRENIKLLHFLFSRRRKLLSSLKDSDHLDRKAVAGYAGKRIESLKPEDFWNVIARKS